jgi:hypothetical protein
MEIIIGDQTAMLEMRDYNKFMRKIATDKFIIIFIKFDNKDEYFRDGFKNEGK